MDIILVGLFHQPHEVWGCSSSEGPLSALSAFPGFSVHLPWEGRVMGQAMAGGLCCSGGFAVVASQVGTWLFE